MKAWIVVVDHPFFAVTGDNGEFTIPGLKDGKYTLVCWHEPAIVQEQEIEVKDGKATANFKVAPRKRAAAAADMIQQAKDVVAVSKTTAEGECEFCNKQTAATGAVAAK